MKKAKENKTLYKLVLLKLLAIVYITSLGLAYLTTNTEARFTNTIIEKQTIQAGEWWDGSSLSFNQPNKEALNHCELPVTLKVEVENDAKHAMYGTSEYEVFKAFRTEEGKIKLGEKVSEEPLEIPIIPSYGKTDLTYTVSTLGSYVFVVYQRPHYAGEGQEAVISDLLTVTCIEEVEELKDHEDPLEEPEPEPEPENVNDEHEEVEKNLEEEMTKQLEQTEGDRSDEEDERQQNTEMVE